MIRDAVEAAVERALEREGLGAVTRDSLVSQIHRYMQPGAAPAAEQAEFLDFLLGYALIQTTPKETETAAGPPGADTKGA